MRSIPLWTSPTVCIWTPTANVIGFKALEGYYDNYLYVQDADVS